MNPADSDRLDRILDRLRDFERRIPLPYERAIVEVARAALSEAASTLARRLGANDYWRLARVAVPARVA